MHKLINTVAVIGINTAVEAVEVNLKGYGGVQQYVETMKMATHFAHLHKIKNYLLAKHHFDDINYHQFFQVAEQWLSFLDQHLSRQCMRKTKVAIVVSRDVFLELSSVIHKAQKALPRAYEHLCFDLFYAYHKAVVFLQPGIRQVISQKS